MPYILADPSSVLDFEHDWTTSWLDDTGSPTDTITSRQWSITPVHGDSPTAPVLVGDTSAVVFVSGMRAGYVYRLTEHIVTASAREDDRTIMIRCEQT
jgi:hypothetical protein